MLPVRVRVNQGVIAMKGEMYTGVDHIAVVSRHSV